MKLIVHDLCAWYGKAQILFDVSLHVGTGDVLALLGRNGAGKSTTLRALIGLVPTVRGRVVFDGRDTAGETTSRIARRGLGYVPEDRRVFTDLTVEENLLVGEQPPRKAAPHWSREKLFDLFPVLRDLRHRPAGQISGGEQQMLTIARTLMGNPSLVLLDEPSEGLAPLVVDRLADAILAMKKEGLSILLAEQNLRLASGVADRAVIIEQGHVRHEGPIDRLLADPAAVRSYLAV